MDLGGDDEIVLGTRQAHIRVVYEHRDMVRDPRSAREPPHVGHRIVERQMHGLLERRVLERAAL
jgi:hypothetical protein